MGLWAEGLDCEADQVSIILYNFLSKNQARFPWIKDHLAIEWYSTVHSYDH